MEAVMIQREELKNVIQECLRKEISKLYNFEEEVLDLYESENFNGYNSFEEKMKNV